MKPPTFDYVAPTDLDEALAALDTPEALVLAGGQSLLLELVYRSRHPRLLVDINQVPGLDQLREDGDGLTLGALVRHADLERVDERGSAVRRLLTRISPYVGHPPIRARGTFCGSVAWAHPAAEWNAVAVALDAELLLASTSGRRRVAAAEWFHGDQRTAGRPGELLTAVRLPPLPPDTGVGFAEHRRTHASFADVAVVAAVTADPLGTVRQLRLAVVGTGDRPLRLTAVEAALVGVESSDVAREVRRTLAAAPDVPGDDHQRAVTAELAARALTEAVAA